MHTTTEQNLINAFGEESIAHMRYLQFAEAAKDERFPNVERLFRSVARAESVHAGDHYQQLRHLDGGFMSNAMSTFGPGNTLKNLTLAIVAEEYEIHEMYPVYIEVARLQKENGAMISFQWAHGTEKMHKALLEKARIAVEAGRDVELGTLHVCNVCGFTVEGEHPDQCALCSATRSDFLTFMQD